MLRTRIVFTLLIFLSLGLLVAASHEAAEKNDEEDAGDDETKNTDTKDEVHLTYSHFKATYNPTDSNKDSIVTIKFNPRVEFDPEIFKDPKTLHPDEHKWLLMKELIVNELFGMSKKNTGFIIQSQGIVRWYNMIVNNRGVIDKKTIKYTPLDDKILWLLEEITLVEPDPSAIALYLQLHPDINKQYYFSHLFRIAATSIVNVADVSGMLYNEKNTELFIQAVFRQLLPVISKIKSPVFEDYLDRYVPNAIRYVVKTVASWPKDRKQGPNVFSVFEYVIFPTTEGDERELFSDNPTYRIFGKKKKKAAKKDEL